MKKDIRRASERERNRAPGNERTIELEREGEMDT